MHITISSVIIHNQMLCVLRTGIKILSNYYGATDMLEALALSHREDYIEIYSNSWGPSDDGETVEGPGMLTSLTLERESREVSTMRYTSCVYYIQKHYLLFPKSTLCVFTQTVC